MKLYNVIKVIIVVLVIAIIVGIVFYIVNENRKEYFVEDVAQYNYYQLKRNGKTGIINTKGEMLIEPVYDDIQIPNPQKAVFICQNDEQNTILNDKTEEILKDYQDIEAIELNGIVSNMPYEKSVLKYKENGKYGLVNLEGKKITSADYDEITSLTNKEGELLVRKDGKYGVINSKGATIIKNKYDTIVADGYYTEQEQYALSGYIVSLTTTEGYRYGYIDSKRKEILKPEYTDITRILEVSKTEDIYLAVVNNGQVGILKNGRPIIDYKYQDIEYNSENQTFTLQRSSKYGLSNLEGKTIIPVEYDSIELSGLYIQANKNEELQTFDLEGNKVNDVVYSAINKTQNENYYITIDKSGKYGIVRNNKEIMVDNKYSYIEYLQGEYFIAINSKGKIGIINPNDTVFAEFIYDVVQKIEGTNVIEAKILSQNITDLYAQDMKKIERVKDAQITVNEYISVSSNETKYLDFNGNEVAAEIALKNNIIFAHKQNEKWGFVDKEGNIIVASIYDEVTQVNEYGFAGIKQNGKWGVVNSEGKVVQEPIYEATNIQPEFISKYYKVYYGYGQSYYTDEINS